MIKHLTVKECNTCGAEKDIREFSLRSNRAGKKNFRCRDCQAEYYRKYYKRNVTRISEQKIGYRRENKEKVAAGKKEYSRKYRFRLALERIAKYSIKEGYAPCIAKEEDIREAFTGFCYSCGVPEAELTKNLCIDHSHETGKFRGWLCGQCNVALGLLRDSTETILLLAEYAKKHS